MNYKVGTKIKLKSAEELQRLNSEEKLENGYVSDMDKYCGKIATIVNVSGYYYTLDIDNGSWYWEDAMIESVITYEKDNDDCGYDYHIGFNFKGRSHEYVADEIKTLNTEGGCEFIRKDGKYMSIPYSWIEYIIPLEKGE